MYDIKLTDKAGNSTIVQSGTNCKLVEDANGNKIPVPNGFSPITTNDQGTKETGFVIKNDTDGNEYVWVPVDDTTTYSYNRYAFTRDNWEYAQTKGEYDGTTNSYKIIMGSYDYTGAMPSIDVTRTELNSVNAYKGFYIGRYEIGVIGILDKSDMIDNYTAPNETWTGYSNGTAVVQEGKQVWNYITRDKAREVAESMYSDNDAIISRLCSSYAWDTALKFIETQNSTYPTNSVGGYYDQSEPSTTGYDTVHPCNIYDMGGNVYEWTTEVSSYTRTPCTLRGGGYYDYASNYPAAYRCNISATYANAYFGFRSTLYL